METSRNTGKSGKILLVAVTIIVAAILVVYFGYFYPPISQEQAAGTIGAVKKYRVQQISEKDVVLAGQEAEQAQAQSAEFLNDAAKLQNIGAQLGNLANRLASQGKLEQKSLENMGTEIDNLSNSLEGLSEDLQARAMANMRAWQTDASKFLESHAAEMESGELAFMQTRLEGISKQLSKMSAKLGSTEFENVANKLAAVSFELESHNHLAAMSVDDMRTQLENANLQLANQSVPVEQGFLENMQREFAEFSKYLESSAQLSSNLVEARRRYGSSIEMENQALANAQMELVEAKRLVKSREEASPAELQSRLANTSRGLLSQSAELEQGVLQGVKAQLNAISMEQSSLENIEAASELSNRLLAKRSELGKQSVEDLQARIAALNQKMVESMTLLERKTVGNLQVQMKFLGNFLENSPAQLDQNSSKYLLNYLSELSSRLRSRQPVLEQQTMESCNAKLRSLAEQLASKASMQNRTR